MLTIDNVVAKLNDYIELPDIKQNQMIQYNAGYETYAFYKFLLNNVEKRLFIFGRKNKKLASNDFDEAFINLLQKTTNVQILYLNPDIEISLNGSAQDIECFRDNLILSIKTMSERFDKSNFDMELFCRMYKEPRDSEIIIADDVIFYKDLEYSEDGKPIHLTNSSFNIVPINSTIGNKYYEKFVETWKGAEVISTEIAKNLK